MRVQRLPRLWPRHKCKIYVSKSLFEQVEDMTESSTRSTKVARNPSDMAVPAASPSFRWRCFVAMTISP